MLDAFSTVVMWLLIGLFLGGPIILLAVMVLGAIWDWRKHGWSLRVAARNFSILAVLSFFILAPYFGRG